MPNGKLSPKHLMFCEEYLIDSNATRAYRKVYNTKNDAAAAVSANRLLRKPNVEAYINDKRKSIAEKLGITQERVLEAFAAIAFCDMREFFNKDGTMKPIHKLPPHVAAALSSIEVEDIKDADGNKFGTTRKLKVWDKRAALDSICRICGFNPPERKEITGKDGKPLKVDTTVSKIKVIIPGEDPIYGGDS